MIDWRSIGVVVASCCARVCWSTVSSRSSARVVTRSFDLRCRRFHISRNLLHNSPHNNPNIYLPYKKPPGGGVVHEVVPRELSYRGSTHFVYIRKGLATSSSVASLRLPINEYIKVNNPIVTIAWMVGNRY